MEVDEIQSQVCKFPRIGSHDDDEDGEVKRNDRLSGGVNGNFGVGGGGSGGGGGGGGGFSRFFGWPSSRIVRVSRASGGKDRHSKVLTSKGLRDRRVRLSVTTAIQFYDLQDRLGYDQPSKAVEWLLQAASSSIAELPEIDTPFSDTPRKQISDENPDDNRNNDAAADIDDQLDQQNTAHISLSRSACSSNSENSKGSGLSLSRSESRIRARERARERAAEKDKKEKENDHQSQPQSLNNHHHHHPISQSSFTELLNGTSNQSPAQQTRTEPMSTRQWSATPMDYFAATGLLGPSSSTRTHQTQSGFSGPMHLGNHPPFGDHNYHQHFSFVPENVIPVAAVSGSHGGGGGGGSDNYNLNFTISSTSGLAGFNRGTLQSNLSSSPSLLPHLQRFTTATTTAADGSNVNVPFFTMENHHQFPPGLDGRLQLFYGEGSRHSDQKGKGKN